MTASVANGFGHALFQPTASTCTMVKYAYHPMYSTSSPDTRVLWAAHSYNVAFSDEIGHFEYCNAVNSFGGSCKASSFPDPTDPARDNDDRSCFPYPVVDPAGATISSLTGCLATDSDFDGPEYHNGTWPGSPGCGRKQRLDADPVQQPALHRTGQQRPAQLQAGGVRDRPTAHRRNGFLRRPTTASGT